MSLNATTLSAAVGASDTSFGVASATGVTAPNFTTGSGVTYWYCEGEQGLVLGVSGTYLNVKRGINGTQAIAHAASAPILFGAYSDFPNFPSNVSLPLPPQQNYVDVNAPVASAATIAASGSLFHVTGGTAINIITPPSGMVEGSVTIIFDSACTWTSSNVTNGIKASGTCTTAGSAVTFYLDAATARWYPSRLA